MNNILQTFGISRELLGVTADYWETLDGDSRNIHEASIISAVEMIAPVPCGHQMIRIGPEGDGSYLVPDDLVGIESCFSPGTCNSKDFEDDLANRYKIKSFMCDYSSDIEKFKTPIIDGLQFFEKKWLDVAESEISVEINSWVARNSPNGDDLLLQMDIEGYEYKNLIHCSSESLKRFRVVVLEIHHLHLLQSPQFLYGVFIPAMKNLTSLFACIHAHPNNCCPVVKLGNNLEMPTVIELTFLRKDRFTKKNIDTPLVLPHPLDILNDPLRNQLDMPAWLMKFADKTLSAQSKSNQKMDWLEKRVQHLTDEVKDMKSKLLTLR